MLKYNRIGWLKRRRSKILNKRKLSRLKSCRCCIKKSDFCKSSCKKYKIRTGRDDRRTWQMEILRAVETRLLKKNKCKSYLRTSRIGSRIKVSMRRDRYYKLMPI